MNFSSSLATLSFSLALARVRPNKLLFLSSHATTAGNSPASGFVSSLPPQPPRRD